MKKSQINHLSFHFKKKSKMKEIGGEISEIKTRKITEKKQRNLKLGFL